jgi:hypothetical protein
MQKQHITPGVVWAETGHYGGSHLTPPANAPLALPGRLDGLKTPLSLLDVRPHSL